MTNKEAFVKSLKTFQTSLPIMFGVLMIIGLINPASNSGYYANLFNGNLFSDSLIGSLMGSISFGNPVTSYVVGGELLSQGVSLVAIAAFILAWSTVGVIMLPLEVVNLGKKFAIARNTICFIFSIIIAILTVLTLTLVQ